MDEYYLAILEKGAASYEISIHEYARQRLLELLDRHDETRLLAELDQVTADVAELREDIARSLEVILVNLTKGDAQAIRSWISDNLRRG
ncbi:MAG: hypothetical protein KGJ62_01525 [Armatimonadetes bacterium]|nr:hypothetical protein [Armatimonadota bacterium]MDE2205460.1 hypothetical protein [Armatimonadota bacterium]